MTALPCILYQRLHDIVRSDGHFCAVADMLRRVCLICLSLCYAGATGDWNKIGPWGIGDDVKGKGEGGTLADAVSPAGNPNVVYSGGASSTTAPAQACSWANTVTVKGFILAEILVRIFRGSLWVASAIAFLCYVFVCVA